MRCTYFKNVLVSTEIFWIGLGNNNCVMRTVGSNFISQYHLPCISFCSESYQLETRGYYVYGNNSWGWRGWLSTEENLLFKHKDLRLDPSTHVRWLKLPVTLFLFWSLPTHVPRPVCVYIHTDTHANTS